MKKLIIFLLIILPIFSFAQSEKLANVKMKYGDQKINAFLDNLSYDTIDFLDDIVTENDKILSDDL